MTKIALKEPSRSFLKSRVKTQYKNGFERVLDVANEYAKENGLCDLTMEDIDSEIAAYRAQNI